MAGEQDVEIGVEHKEGLADRIHDDLRERARIPDVIEEPFQRQHFPLAQGP